MMFKFKRHKSDRRSSRNLLRNRVKTGSLKHYGFLLPSTSRERGPDFSEYLHGYLGARSPTVYEAYSNSDDDGSSDERSATEVIV